MNGSVFSHFIRTFADRMNKGIKTTIMIRVFSTTFVVVALAVFKPFGLEAWQWQAYVHLLVVWAMGIGICMLTDAILKYILRKPGSLDRGVDYIIRRNLWFQIINTPLISLMICLYRHFMLNDRVAGNLLSWSNFFETLLIVAFCSFAVGLYWRFKFRSRYLATELRETKLLNEQLKRMQEETSAIPSKGENAEALASSDGQKSPLSERLGESVTLTGTTSESITLDISHLLYIEAVGNYVKVYQLHDGQVRSDMLRATSKQMEDDLHAYPMIVRCHRAFLVNLGQVEQIVSHSGTMQLIIKHCHESIPVSRSHISGVKEAIK